MTERSLTWRWQAMAQPAGLPPIDPEALAAARSALPPQELLDIVVETFAALGDPTRARILYALGRRCLCVRALALLVGVSEAAVSHQLRLLREWGLVRSRREGNVVYYALHDLALRPLDGCAAKAPAELFG